MARPHFSAAWAAFNRVYGDGTLTSVANLLGGKVKENIDSGVFTNGCAIRMSHVLNSTGTVIPFIAGRTVSGKHHKWYLFRVRDLASFVRQKFGPPDFVLSPARPGQIRGILALLVFEVSAWTDASGHATIWNGVTCSDHCYFPEANTVNVWRLS
jgi:hypothetical protein